MCSTFMERTSLAPGFRFHPTDVELIMYYLKRKASGMKLHFEAIAEVNLYEYSPWDLPDKSYLKSKDLQWYFFCPREKKYASGSRFKRATENGYWKTTGKDRLVRYNEEVVGSVRTLIFHLGSSRQGVRTNWVMHEYSIKDDQLAAAGVQGTYVLCKVFEKDGPGPKNGAQYGGPFDEAEWTDDVDDPPSHPMLLASDIPLPTQQEKKAYPPGSTSRFPMTESAPPPGGDSSSVLVEDETDKIECQLASTADANTLLNRTSQDDLSGNGKNTLPSSDDDIYSNLSPLDDWAERSASITALSKIPQDLDFIELDDLDDLVQSGEGRTDLSRMVQDSFIELKDLQWPLNRLYRFEVKSLPGEMSGSSINKIKQVQYGGLDQKTCESSACTT